MGSLAYLLLPPALVVLVLTFHIRALRLSNLERRNALIKSSGSSSQRTKKIVGFFHPYCNAGGGGERVLWTAVRAMQCTEPDVISVVYSGDIDASKDQIIAKVKARFEITLDPDTLHFVFLNSRWAVEDATWRHFTLLGQSLGSIYLAYEALSKLIPDLYIDTMGYAFTLPVFALLCGVPVGAYVHYPTISTDMLARVRSRSASHTNADVVRRSSLLSNGKLLYYRAFMYVYAHCLRTSSFLMANGSWTKNHVDSIIVHSDPLFDLLFAPLAFTLGFFFGRRGAVVREVQIVFPPCDTREMATFKLEGRERVVLSIAQFRPEKDHIMQVRAFAALLEAHPELKDANVRLVLIGGSRNAGDQQRVEMLQAMVQEAGLTDSVEFIVNASYPVMLGWLARASVGLSTMVDEHFGINVVEFMAAGVIPVAHASAGPLNDIVVPVDGQPTGYHAKTRDEFAQAMYRALTLPPVEELAMRARARHWAVQTFSEAEFERGWAASGWRKWAGLGE
ncbi:glycosyltransferase family 4 protein [Plicaturopsis crispa FD-325 SS-3]|nr:glycosyltransferase family 4 protein [Plicaturopsis crispa FD-325 SS-3]